MGLLYKKKDLLSSRAPLRAESCSALPQSSESIFFMFKNFEFRFLDKHLLSARDYQMCLIFKTRGAGLPHLRFFFSRCTVDKSRFSLFFSLGDVGHARQVKRVGGRNSPLFFFFFYKNKTKLYYHVDGLPLCSEK